ncbi:MAG: hypothetical protein ACKVS6_15280 [Planctomycetota bacterium]
MLEEANTTEAVASSESTPDLLKQALSTKTLYTIEPRPGWIGVADRLRRGDWLVEIFIVASIGLAGFILIWDGLFDTNAKMPGSGEVLPVHAATDSKENRDTKEPADAPHGPRIVAMVADAEKSLEAGLGDGTQHLEHILNALKLATLQKSTAQKSTAQKSTAQKSSAGLGTAAPRGADVNNANFTRSSAILERSSESTCADLNHLFRSEFVDIANNTILSHAPLEFLSNPKMNGCVFVAENKNYKNGSGTEASALGVSVEIATASLLLVGGYKRIAARYSLIMEVGADRKILSGRLRIEMPGVEIPADDGDRSADFRMGDDLAWTGVHGSPPSELLNQIADSVRGILSK